MKRTPIRVEGPIGGSRGVTVCTGCPERAEVFAVDTNQGHLFLCQKCIAKADTAPRVELVTGRRERKARVDAMSHTVRPPKAPPKPR